MVGTSSYSRKMYESAEAELFNSRRGPTWWIHHSMKVNFVLWQRILEQFCW